MRVIAGDKKGRRLVTPQGLDTRPTSDKVKEALFSIIQFELEGALFLDLFAGSGQMGIEALSRGAQRAVFVDMGRKPCECIRQNLKQLGLSQSGEIVMQSAEQFVSLCKEKFDIIFLDPPYRDELIAPIFMSLTEIVSQNGAIICEVPRGEVLPDEVNGFKLFRRYRYGKTELVIYRSSNSETEIY